MIVGIGSSIAAGDWVRGRYCEASGEDAELAALLAAVAERFGLARLTREPGGGRGIVSWRQAPADLIERSGGVSGLDAFALSTIGRLAFRDGCLAPASTTGVAGEPTPPQRPERCRESPMRGPTVSAPRVASTGVMATSPVRARQLIRSPTPARKAE